MGDSPENVAANQKATAGYIHDPGTRLDSGLIFHNLISCHQCALRTRLSSDKCKFARHQFESVRVENLELAILKADSEYIQPSWLASNIYI